MKTKLLIGIVLIILGLASVPSVYFYTKYRAVQSAVPQPLSAQDLIAKIGRHILLPSGETPTVMTVTDKEKLSGQAFFTNAKNGDTVLIFEKAKKAFLYDADADKVIEVGPIVVSSPSPPAPATGTGTIKI